MTLPEPLAGLVHDHRYVERLLLDTRRSVSAALGEGVTPNQTHAAMEQVRDLAAFLSVDLVLHIEKEEQVLFPAVRAWALAEMEVILADMRHQHDEIRDGSEEVADLLDALDHDHTELRTQSGLLAAQLSAAPGSQQDATALRAFDSQLRTLDALLQGHFLDEEANVFEPAARRMEPQEFASLAAQMAALDEGGL